MTKLKELMRERFSLANMLFSALFSLLCCFIIYPVLRPLCTYNNLNDFYVGISIYENHNKYLDIGMVFLYVGIFYIIFLLNRIDFSFFSKIRTEQYLVKYKKYLNLFLALIITVLGIYILCKPHGVWMIDTHHYGEKFAVYYAHIKYGIAHNH